MTPLSWAILAGALGAIGGGCWWWGYEGPRRERRKREAIWASVTAWVSEGEPPAQLATWLEVARAALPDWWPGGWGGVFRWSPVPLQGGYGKGLTGDRIVDADRAVVELQRVPRAFLHALWHVDAQRHGREGEPPESWLRVAEAEIARRGG